MNKNEEKTDLIGRQETAKLLKINTVTLWRYLRAGKLPYYRVGRKLLFKKDEIIESIRIQ
jgi:excisionase family DNA binding protein